MLVLLMAPAAARVDRPAVEASFREWIAGDLRAEAEAAGVSRATYRDAMDGVTLDWDLPDLQPPGADPPRAEYQAEFRSPGAYFDEKRLAALVKGGRQRLKSWERTLAAAERAYGVPPGIVVAIWGRESAFGEVAIPNNALRTLATHAFIGRRPALYRAELIAALQLIEAGDMTAAEMRSSWGGALGQPQFLPSKVLRHAVDFDGDGRRDIVESEADTLGSIAHYLRQEGWQAGRPWGYEVMVPAEVACTLEGPDQGRPIAEWAAMGIAPVGGGAFPRSERRQQGFLLMPAGRFGPAYVVTPNFYVLKAYNESDLYALFIGHLADRFADNRPFVADWQALGGFDRGDVRAMQRRLEADGHDVGGADGLVGFRTRVAVGRWQASAGVPVTCFPSADLVSRLR